MTSPLDIYRFGDALISTRDLDPVYCALYGARLDRDQLARLLLAYWHFYHLGMSAWLSEQDDFWKACIVAAENVEPSPLNSCWPRGVERRHFRGEKSIEAIRRLSGTSPLKLVQGLSRLRTLSAITDQISSWDLCGNWISFKAADMLDRVWGVEVEFPLEVCLLYKEPRAALALLAPTSPEEKLNELIMYFARRAAPPAGVRASNVQEVETILCKWKSAINGYYWVGKDIYEMRCGLKGWGHTASLLLDCSPVECCRSGELF